MRGILRFTQQHAMWASDIRIGRFEEDALRNINKSQIDGLITYAITPTVTQHLQRKRIPIVLLDCESFCSTTIAHVDCDNLSISRLAARHLRDLNLQHFAYVPGPKHMPWEMDRGELFKKELVRLGSPSPKFFMGKRKDLGSWLMTLPKPVGLFAATDIIARIVIDEASAVNIQMPAEMAVLGTDDDDTICETIFPSISSVIMDAEAAGFKAAEALNQAMANRRKFHSEPMHITYGGVAVHARMSTRHTNRHDLLVDRCLEIMEANLATSFSIGALLKTLHASRRTLENRFKSVLGCSPHQKIVMLRGERAKLLLKTTSLSHETIAENCGFCSASHMNTVFRRLYGASPSSVQRDAAVSAFLRNTGENPATYVHSTQALGAC